MSFGDVADTLECTLDDVRRWVMEDRTLKAVRVDPNGHKVEFTIGNLHTIDVGVDGAVTNCVNGSSLGNLRIEYVEVARFLLIYNREVRRTIDAEGKLANDPEVGDRKEQSDAVNLDLLATPTQLFDAFGKWGLKSAWFGDLSSHKWLLEQRMVKGHGQRGHTTRPLFKVLGVMNGLITKVRQTKRLSSEAAWRTLELKFPKVYAEYISLDPRERTRD